jgi:hypothetical protein
LAPTEAPDPSPPATDCYDEYGISEEDKTKKFGADVLLPENAIRIINGEHTNITLEISQLWSDNANISFFMQYNLDGEGTVCEGTPDFEYEDALIKNLECYDGWAAFSIVAYFDDTLSLEDCDGCKHPEDGDESVVGYYFEIPCEPICESDAPSEVPSFAPTDCFDKHGITEEDLIEKFGPPETPIPQNAIKIINGEYHNVTLEISQLWSEDVNVSAFLHYHAVGHGSVCEGIPDFEYEDTIEKEMECYDGWTDVGLFIYLDEELTLDECEECKPPDEDDENIVAYYFEVLCEPVCEDLAPSETLSTGVEEEPGCYDGIAVKRISGEDSMCGIESIPFVVEQFADGGSKQIEFSFTNHWDATLNDITLFYDRGDGDESQSLNSLSPGSMYPNVLAAACDPNTQMYTEIELLISYVDGSCSFKYQLPCSNDVDICGDSDSNRKLQDIVAKAEIDEDEDAPYCAHKDNPCEGDEENMVYVCHYSGRAGYQTFCMPEMDSDVIRFNKNHYCGPCDGWNGVEQNVKN